MKKVYTLACVLASTLGVTAQQLPNPGFEEDWVESTPWNTVYTGLTMTESLRNMDPEAAEVLQPSKWTVANVLGVVSEKDGGGYGGVGSTTVGFKAEGCNSSTAVKLVNNPNLFMSTQIVPAYLTLGTSWATNTLDWSTFSPANKDGGVFGGLEFSSRPDALVFDYKLEAPAGGEGQKATALVYAWKGQWSQADVPGNNSMTTEAVKTTMIDRDRNILGMTTDQGGAVTKSEDAELIAKGLQYIETFSADWKSCELPIEYLSDAAATKINVVLSANDYFDSNNIVSGNALTVDNLKFVYYSRLKALEIGGKAVPGFSSDVYSYEVDGDVPALTDVVATAMANTKSAKVETSVDNAARTLTVKVSNSNADGLDVDGEATHTYVVKFNEVSAVSPAYGGNYKGDVSVSLGDDPVVVSGTVEITPDAANPAKCTFKLPNFSLGEGANFGDIVVPDVQVAATSDGFTVTGAVDGLKLHNETMGEIVANVKLSGTITNDGVATLEIPVEWVMGTNKVPIDVKFNGKKEAAGIDDVNVSADAPIEYYNLNGVRVASDRLASGLYIKRQGNKVEKVFVK